MDSNQTDNHPKLSDIIEKYLDTDDEKTDTFNQFWRRKDVKYDGAYMYIPDRYKTSDSTDRFIRDGTSDDYKLPTGLDYTPPLYPIYPRPIYMHPDGKFYITPFNSDHEHSDSDSSDNG